MRWYKKILFWEIHRIPMNIIIISFMLLLSSQPLPTMSSNTDDDGFFSLNSNMLMLVILIIFNTLYTFTWIIALFQRIYNMKKSKIILSLIYFICFVFILILMLVKLSK